MNINLEKAKNEFITYTENYNLENENIKRKQLHSLRVMKISGKIAEGLKLQQEEVELAELIGLLHDIARFEQYTKYNTFKDIESIDHGDLGAKILKESIRNFVDTDKYDGIIIKAVKNHNKYKIGKNLTEKEKIFAKIIRDADKIDIYYESVEMFWKGKEEKVEKSIISEETLKQFQNLVQIKSKENETEIDNVIRVIAFIFDINYKASFQILKEQDYINKTLNRYNLEDAYTREKVEEIREIANEYIKSKI